MNERELRVKIADLQKKFDEARTNNVGPEELRGIVKELKAVREELDLVMEARALGNPQIDPDDDRNKVPKVDKRSISELEEEEVENRYTKVFLKALRGRKITDEDERIFERVKSIRKFESGIDENGGFIVPADVQTKINELRRQFVSLENLVTVEQVSTLSGSRVLEKLADITPFASIDEWDEIEEVENPKFSQIKYGIKAYAGILPIPNTLLQDNDANLLNYVYKWLAKKSVITRNNQILMLLQAFSDTVPVATIDDLKNIFNVKLDPDITTTSSVVTNQDGFNFLDKLKDEKGNYILQPHPVEKTKKVLFGVYPVNVIGNKFLPTTSEKAPVFCGDLKEALVLFDRGVYEITATNVGGKSFTRNTTDIRVIDRFDVQSWDEEAVVHGQIGIAESGGTGE